MMRLIAFMDSGGLNRAFQAHPRRSVVTGSGLAAHPGVHAGIDQFRSEDRVEQQVIDPHTGILLPMLTKVIPESVNPLVREMRPDRIRPALGEQPLITLAGLWLQQGIIDP